MFDDDDHDPDWMFDDGDHDHDWMFVFVDVLESKILFLFEYDWTMIFQRVNLVSLAVYLLLKMEFLQIFRY
jgi:hypothetical protein